MAAVGFDGATVSLRRMRVVSSGAILAATALVLGSTLLIAAPAHAAPATAVVDGVTYSYDDSGTPATATITDYDPTTSSLGYSPNIPAAVTIGAHSYTVTEIDDSAFQSKGLTAVTIPSTVTDIGSSAFYANSLSSVVIPSAVDAISSSAFAYNSLTSVTLPTNLLTIGNWAFEHNQLASVVFPNSVTSIGQDAFAYNNLSSVTIGNSVTVIKKEAFYVNQLPSLVIPDSVTTIEESAFDSNQLSSLTLGNSLATIGDDAFLHNQLTTVIFPASIAGIGFAAFYDNAGLTDVVFLGAAPTTFSAAGVPYGSLGPPPGPLVHYPSSFAAPPAGGYTTPTWEGYNAQRNPIVSFDLGGHGAAIAPEDVGFGSTVAAPPAPTASGWTFTGWFTDAAHSSSAKFSNPVSKDTTLYAGWKADPQLAATGGTVPVEPVALFAAILLLAGIFLRTRGRHATR